MGRKTAAEVKAYFDKFIEILNNEITKSKDEDKPITNTDIEAYLFQNKLTNINTPQTKYTTRLVKQFVNKIINIFLIEYKNTLELYQLMTNYITTNDETYRNIKTMNAYMEQFSKYPITLPYKISTEEYNLIPNETVKSFFESDYDSDGLQMAGRPYYKLNPEKVPSLDITNLSETDGKVLDILSDPMTREHWLRVLDGKETKRHEIHKALTQTAGKKSHKRRKSNKRRKTRKHKRH